MSFQTWELNLFRFAFKMIPRRQGGGDTDVHRSYFEEPTTQPTQAALECESE
jgi:hypothetical protein